MATANLLGSNQSITLEWNKVITITRRTVRFSNTVYQTHNIAGFGEGEVDIGTIHHTIIIVLLFLGAILSISDIYYISNIRGIGSWLIFAGTACTFWNVFKPKHYGLLLTLNSGDKKLFITTDKKGLKQVIEAIYDVIETEDEATYEISVNHSHINGNFIQGYVGKDVSYRANDSDCSEDK